jgi:PAS domain S-box-containing protein
LAVAVLARSRHPGGLAVAPCVAMTLGAIVLAVSDLMFQAGALETRCEGMLALAVMLWTMGAWLPGDGAESDPETHWRERVAVLAPLAPLSAAAAVLLGSTVFDHRLSGVSLAAAVLLTATVVAGGVMARLDTLGTERTLDELVLKRTITIGTREKWFRSLVQNSSDVITVVDVRGIVRYLTPSVTPILGHDPKLLVGTRFTALLRPGDGRRLDAALASAARSPGRPVTLDFPIWAKSGAWCDTETTVTSLVHDPDIRGLVLNTRDISERRRLEEQLTLQAYSDGLTGLANRSLFRSKVETALKVALDRAEVGVLFLDLDGFKAVNDARATTSETSCWASWPSGSPTRCGRATWWPGLGGDEFAILVTGPDAEEGAIWAAERVRRALSAPFVLDGRELALGASTGIAISDTGEETADQLLRNADLAMYRAKSRRDQSFVRFEAQMHDALLARMKAESDLRQAVTRGDLVMYYQPVVELSSRTVIGVEALVRWKHHERGHHLAGRLHRPGRGDRAGGRDRPLGPGGELQAGRPVAEARGTRRATSRWRSTCRPASSTRPCPARCATSCRAPGCPVRPDPGDDRERADGAHRRGRGAAPADEDPRPQGGGRRLRHRLLVAVLPVPVPGRHPQDRQVLRAAPRERQRQGRAGAHDRPARRVAAAGHRRRGHRDRRPSASR